MRCLPFAVSIALASVAIAAAPAAKKPAPPPAKPKPAASQPAPAQVKGDPYSIAVPVDASAASGSAAQTAAINGGRARAWAALSHRLVPQKDWGKLPNLDDPGLERLIRGYTVANEKRSTTRYVARITYIFNPNAVRHLLRVANVGSTESGGGSAILLVALSPSYSAESPWARAVAQAKHASAQFPLVTPLGDEVDQSALGSLRFGSAGWGQIEAAASRVHAGEAVVLQASNPAASKMTVRMRRVGPGRSAVVLADVEVPLPTGTSPEKAYATAADQAEAAIEDAWKNKGTIEVNKKAKLVAEIRITSLEQWSSTLARLAAVTNVSDVSILAMNTGEGRVAISYTGTPDQLRTAAGQSNLSLVDRGGFWWVGNGKASDDTDSPG